MAYDKLITGTNSARDIVRRPARRPGPTDPRRSASSAAREARWPVGRTRGPVGLPGRRRRLAAGSIARHRGGRTRRDARAACDHPRGVRRRQVPSSSREPRAATSPGSHGGDRVPGSRRGEARVRPPRASRPARACRRRRRVRGQGASAGCSPQLPPCELGDEAIDGALPAMLTAGTPSFDNNRASRPATRTSGSSSTTTSRSTRCRAASATTTRTRSSTSARPRLDLDSLYGSGPADQPYLYDWRCRPHPGVRLLVGRNPRGAERARRPAAQRAGPRADRRCRATTRTSSSPSCTCCSSAFTTRSSTAFATQQRR